MPNFMRRRIPPLAILLLLLGAGTGAAGDEVVLSTHGAEMSPRHNILTVSRAGRRRYRLAAPLIEIVYRHDGPQAQDEPDLIVTDYAGGAHCCWTVHVIGLGAKLTEDRIAIRDSELEFDHSVTPPRLRLRDYAFAYWKASFADSPAPLVVLAWDRQARRYLPDPAAMRQPAPDPAALSAAAAEVRAKLAASPGDRPDPALWERMLDLIYAGNAAAARQFFDQAWPPERRGKPEFLAEFTRQLRSGDLWRRYNLGRRLGTEGVF